MSVALTCISGRDIMHLRAVPMPVVHPPSLGLGITGRPGDLVYAPSRERFWLPNLAIRAGVSGQGQSGAPYNPERVPLQRGHAWNWRGQFFMRPCPNGQDSAFQAEEACSTHAGRSIYEVPASECFAHRQRQVLPGTSFFSRIGASRTDWRA